MAPGFVAVAGLDQITSARAIVIGDTTVALFRVGGCVFALDDACIRCGASLAAGALDGGIVSCSACGWRYDIKTGSVIGVAALRTDTFEVGIADSRVLVGVRDPRAAK